VRTGCLISRRGRTDGAWVGLRGRNPDRNQSLKNFPIPPCPTLLRPAVAGLRWAERTGNSIRRRRYLDGSQLPQTNSTGFTIRGSRLW